MTSSISELEIQLQNAPVHTRLSIYSQLIELCLRQDLNKGLHFSEEALELADKSADSPDRARVYLTCGEIQIRTGHSEAALTCIENSLAVADRLQSKEAQANAMNLLGIVHGSSGNYKQALDFFQKVLQLHESENNLEGIVSALNNIGQGYAHLGEFNKSLTHQQRALEVQRSTGDESRCADILNNIGLNYGHLSLWAEALDNHLQALKIHEDTGNLVGQANALSNIGMIYGQLQNHDQALVCFQQTLEMRKKMGDRRGECISLSNIGQALDASGNNTEALQHYIDALSIARKLKKPYLIAHIVTELGRIHLQEDNLAAAEQWLTESLNIRKEIQDQNGNAQTLVELGELYHRQGELEKTQKTFFEALELAEKSENQDLTQAICRRLAEICAELGDYQQALEFSRRHCVISEILYDERNSRSIAEMQARYETEKKEREAEIYRLKNVELARYRDHLEELVEQRTHELREKQDQLLHSERLASLGEMATGVAHELAQPLAVIRASSELGRLICRKPVEDLSDLLAEFESILVETDRAAEILDSMREFSRKTVSASEPIDINESIRKSLVFFTKQFRNHNIELITDLTSDLPEVIINGQHLEQIAVNLLTNARHAVETKSRNGPSGYKMIVHVKTSYDSDGQKLIFSVEDNGIGMTPEQKQECMRPFFTTKDVREGTGLGLSIVQGILQEFKGKMVIDSTYREGTTIQIIVPVLA